MIARAAEGSARDGLSILDQAIAHGGGAVTAEQVRDMLGLADRGRIRRLLELVLCRRCGGGAGRARRGARARDRSDSLMRGLMESLHARHARQGGASSRGAAVRRGARKCRGDGAASSSWGTIHRLWQMLLKGLQDVEIAPDPREAAEMALLRLIHAADMPDPAALLPKLSGEGAGARRRRSTRQGQRVRTAQLPADFPGAHRSA